MTNEEIAEEIAENAYSQTRHLGRGACLDVLTDVIENLQSACTCLREEAED